MPQPFLNPVYATWLAQPVRLQQVLIKRGTRQLCQPVNGVLNAGDVWHIQGENGRGKSTFLAMLAGLLPTLNHSLIWSERSNHAQLVPPSQWPVLFLGHLPAINPGLTVQANLQFLALLNAHQVTEEALWLALAAVGLSGYEQTLVNRLSSGQRRRVGLARLFLPNQPPLWLLDEPLTALDIAMIERLGKHIAAYAQAGGRVVLTSHQPIYGVTHCQMLESVDLAEVD